MTFYPKQQDGYKANLSAKKLLDDHESVSDVKMKLDSDHGPGMGKETLKDFDKKSADFKRKAIRKNNRILGIKETIDKISFGTGNLQFINILFYILMPSYIIIGAFLALRSYIVSHIEQRHPQTKDMDKLKTRSYWYGAALGYMFIFMAFAVTFSSWIMFSVLLLGIGVFGALYMQSSSCLSAISMPRDKKGHYLKWISYYGLPLTAIVMVLAGIIIDTLRVPMYIAAGDAIITIYGYAILFILAGILLIVSSFVQSNLKSLIAETQGEHADIAMVHHTEKRDPFTTGLLLAGIIFFSLQTSFNYLLGLYLFETYESFTFVALLLAATLLASFLSPLFFDKSTIKKAGKSFILLFGTGLALFLPLLLALTTNSNIKSGIIGLLQSAGYMGTEHVVTFMPLFYLIIGITGASVAGIAYSRITRELMQNEDRIEFSSALGKSIGIGTAVFIMLFFGLRHLTGEFWISFLAVTILYVIVAVMFARLVSTKSEQEYQKRRFESRIVHNKL
jgi:MFS family permease